MTPAVLKPPRPLRLSHSKTALLLAASCALCAPLAAQAQAQAQPAAPAPENPASATVVPSLTVTGAAPPKVIEKQTWTFVEAYAAESPKLGQIARWEEPICVKIVNLTPEQTAMVQTRIEQVARDVGLRVRKAGCQSNIQIVLTSEPQAVVDKIAKADEHALGFHWRSDLKKVKTVSRPIRSWYKTATRSGKVAKDGLAFANATDANGEPILDLQELTGANNATEVVDSPENPTPNACAGSLISDCLRSVFKNVLVVVDSHAVEGKDLGAVADYLAMVALSQPRSQDGCSALPSIFDLMAKSPCPGRDPPDELSSADGAYLTALYASDPESRAASQRVEMANRMSEMLIKSNSAVPQVRAGGNGGEKR